MKKVAIALALALACLLGPNAVASAATIDTLHPPRTCAYHVEYYMVKYGMTRAQVRPILHNNGITISYHAIPRLPYWTTIRVVRYPVCVRGYILLTYVNGRVRIKVHRW